MKPAALRLALYALLLCLVPIPAWGGDVKGALAYVPADAIAIVGADVDRLRLSPLYAPLVDRFLKETGVRKELDALVAGTGFDPRRDVHAVVVAIPRAFVKDDDEFVVIVEAKVDEARIVEFAKTQGGAFERKNGPLTGPYYSVDGGKGGIAFRGPFVVLAAKHTFPRALAAARGPSPLVQGRWATRLGAASAHDVFVVGDLPAEVQSKMKGALPGGGALKAFAAHLDLRSGIEAEAKATTSAPETAQALAGLIEQGLDEVRQDPQVKKLGLLGYLAKLSVKATGPDLELSVKLTEAQVKNLVGLLRKL